MKIKMKYIVAQACLVAGASIALTSCNDFLDREPLDQVTPQSISRLQTTWQHIPFQNTTLCSQHIADGMPVR